jgi:dolichol-phosphate mannosyltransferase
VYYNAEGLNELYEDIQKQVVEKLTDEVELVFVDDGSGDSSWDVLKSLAERDKNVKIIHLSRNFGAHAAILCGLANASGDCAVVKAADMQEPSSIILNMLESWKQGNHVVLALREERSDGAVNDALANLNYWIVQRIAIPNLPKGGFDVYLLDRKVIRELVEMNEKNSVIGGQILWAGFKTGTVSYVRQKRNYGKSRFTFRKKWKISMDSIFSFTMLPIHIVTAIGAISFAGSLIFAITVFIKWTLGQIGVPGWTTLSIISLFSFSIIMLTLGLLGGYLWRTFDASRGRPLYIIEDTNIEKDLEDND